MKKYIDATPNWENLFESNKDLFMLVTPILHI